MYVHHHTSQIKLIHNITSAIQTTTYLNIFIVLIKLLKLKILILYYNTIPNNTKEEPLPKKYLFLKLNFKPIHQCIWHFEIFAYISRQVSCFAYIMYTGNIF